MVCVPICFSVCPSLCAPPGLSRSTSVRTERIWSEPRTEATLTTALTLSLCIGLLFASFVLIATTTVLSHTQRTYFSERQAARVATMGKQGLSNAAQASLRAEEAKSHSHNEDAQPPLRNPWLTPFRLLTMLVIKPMRKRIIKSVPKFVRERLVRDDPESGRFVYLRSLCASYELFCLEHDLQMAGSRNEIQRLLVEDFGVRVTQTITSRVLGLRWRTPYDCAPKLPDDMPAALAAAVPALGAAQPVTEGQAGSTSANATEKQQARRDAELATLRAFVADQCIADLRPGHFLDLQTRTGPSGLPREGLAPALATWCQKRGLAVPRRSSLARLLPRVLPRGATFHEDLKSRKLTGLAWRHLVDDADAVAFSSNWYALEILTVVLHCSVVVVIPITMVMHALVLQDVWATYFCPEQGIDGRHPLLWADVTGSRITSGTSPAISSLYVVPVVQAITLEALAFLSASFVRLMFFYLRLPLPLLNAAIRWLYMVVLLVHLFVFLTYLGIFAAWMVLAAALEPTRFLPFGVAVLALFVVAVTVNQQMTFAADRLKEKIKKAYAALAD